MQSCSSAPPSHKDPTQLSHINNSPAMHEKARGRQGIRKGEKEAMKTE